MRDTDALMIDLVLAWNWYFDRGFLKILGSLTSERGFTFLAVSSENLEVTMANFLKYPFVAGAFLDRASESDGQFVRLQNWAENRSLVNLNRREHAQHASDKAAVHYDLIKAGIHTPYTIVVPPFNTVPDIGQIDLALLTKPFVAKPSHGGGSEGVALQVGDYEQIQNARQKFPADAFLLQSTIMPEMIDSVPAWFRLIYCLGHVFVSWWDTASHVYTPVSRRPVAEKLENELAQTSRTIASTLKMDIFSSEAALTADGNLVVVDYLNDPIDLRLQSEAFDGVPDETVERIAEMVVGTAGSN